MQTNLTSEIYMLILRTSIRDHCIYQQVGLQCGTLNMCQASKEEISIIYIDLHNTSVR